MKVKVAGKQLKENFTVVTVGYCELPELLQYREPLYYNAGVYGWNYDAYIIGGVAIVTGYRPINGVRPSWELAREYNLKAREIVYNWDIPHDEKRARVDSLLMDFIKSVLG